MGLFDKVKNKDKDQEQEELSMDFPITGVLDEQDESEELPTLDALVGATTGLDSGDGDPDDEKAVLDESLGLLDDALAGTTSSGADDELAVLEGEDAEEDDDDLGDLMDIFTNEEEEDVDMTALLSNLQDVSGQEVLDLALEVSEGLRSLYSEVA